MIKRVLRERGRSWQFPEENRIGSNRYSKLQEDPFGHASAAERGRNADAPWYRQAKETKCGEKAVRKSECPIVASKRGNGPYRTLWSEGGAALWTRCRTHAEDTVPHQRVLVRRRNV